MERSLSSRRLLQTDGRAFSHGPGLGPPGLAHNRTRTPRMEPLGSGPHRPPRRCLLGAVTPIMCLCRGSWSLSQIMGTEGRCPQELSAWTPPAVPSSGPLWLPAQRSPPARRNTPRPPHGGAPLRVEEPRCTKEPPAACRSPAVAPPTLPVLPVTTPFLEVQLFHTSCPVADGFLTQVEPGNP